MNTETRTKTETHILKKGTCPSLSNRSELGYHIGLDAESGLMMRITGNSGAGKYNSLWVSINEVLEIMRQQKDTFCWDVLAPLMSGKSINNACFLMAALKHEGVLDTSERKYRLNDPENFIKKMISFATKDDKKRGMK